MLGMRSVRAHGSAALALSNLRLNDENKIKIMANMRAQCAAAVAITPHAGACCGLTTQHRRQILMNEVANADAGDTLLRISWTPWGWAASGALTVGV